MRGALVLVAVAASCALAACGATQRAAHQDPMRCERDPKCERRRGRTADCSTECSDDPACVERCEEVQAHTKLGH